MKLTSRKNTKKASAVKKQSFDFKGFSNSINALNKDNFGSAPLPVKVFIIVVLVAILSVIAWLALVQPKLKDIEAAQAERETLLSTYKEKESKARYLQEYTDQVNQMEIDFAELLNQLPKDTRVSDLIEGINMVGSGSGIRFQDISVEPEVEQEFFIEQPIRVTAIGEYHQFGNFTTGIAALPRIITMHDFELKNQNPSLDVMPQIQLVLHTKTYRSKEMAEEENAEAASAGGQ